MIRLNWTGGEHDFALRLGELRALQDACDAGPEEIFNRLRLGTWRVDDVIEPLRLGLIGSGAMPSAQAGPFVSKIADQNPPIALKMTAFAILQDALLGPEDDPVGEEQGEAPPRENGASAQSTETAP